MALAGLYAYSLQGWMQARNISPDVDGTGRAGTTIRPAAIHPGWGDPNEEKWWSRKWRHYGEPAGDPARAVLLNENRLLAVTVAGAYSGLVPGGEPLQPLVEGGYYPFSELGVWYFQDGSMSGWTSVNTAGHTGDTGIPYTRVFGKYQQNATKNKTTGLLSTMPTGAISAWLPDIPPGIHFWDYFFVLNSDVEAQIIVADRLPRPGTGVGTLCQISRKMPDYIEWPVSEPEVHY